MKNSVDHPIGLSLVLILLASSLWAQVPAPSQADGQASETRAAVAAVQPPAVSAGKPHDSSFVIGNDDVLSINVWKEPDVSRSIPVRPDGRISLPLVGGSAGGWKDPVTARTGDCH